jgi:hypothetical protein
MLKRTPQDGTARRFRATEDANSTDRSGWTCTNCRRLLGVQRGERVHVRMSRGSEPEWRGSTPASRQGRCAAQGSGQPQCRRTCAGPGASVRGIEDARCEVPARNSGGAERAGYAHPAQWAVACVERQEFVGAD